MEKRNLALKDNHKHSNGFRLDSKVAVVTGAASGIGRAIAQRFAQEGAAVRLGDVDEKAAADAAREILEAGGPASTHACDVSNHRCADELSQKLADQKPIEVLRNN